MTLVESSRNVDKMTTLLQLGTVKGAIESIVNGLAEDLSSLQQVSRPLKAMAAKDPKRDLVELGGRELPCAPPPLHIQSSPKKTHSDNQNLSTSVTTSLAKTGAALQPSSNTTICKSTTATPQNHTFRAKRTNAASIDPALAAQIDTKLVQHVRELQQRLRQSDVLHRETLERNLELEASLAASEKQRSKISASEGTILFFNYVNTFYINNKKPWLLS